MALSNFAGLKAKSDCSGTFLILKKTKFEFPSGTSKLVAVLMDFNGKLVDANLWKNDIAAFDDSTHVGDVLEITRWNCDVKWQQYKSRIATSAATSETLDLTFNTSKSKYAKSSLTAINIDDHINYNAIEDQSKHQGYKFNNISSLSLSLYLHN
jgi:hypothetical protein